ncbi:FecR family protein [Pedobacter foliorum]|uniref:FecR family protein n=1 Tax=Pedobacter foliorum TaxID=2739058 RepID=UPI0015678C7D|nr:FecR family protein [Pedobacter foliorum]NRF39386.1 FecR family protein [Pedobacter foliorum]
MKEKQKLEDLYNLYLNNKCTSDELEAFFKLLDSASDDHEIKALMSTTWDNTHTLPDTDLIPDFIPFETKQFKLNPPNKMTLRLRRFVSVAAALLFILGGLYFFKSDILNIITPVHQQQVLSSTGERKQLLLADGTKVWLSPNSKLNYPDKFRGDQRLISLDGEAFFEVKHDSKHPFIIKTGTVSTTVLGTSFNISAYPKHNTINVTLVTGKVAVALKANNQSQSEIMLPNQQIIVDKANEKLTKVDFPGAASFLNKRLGLFEYKGAVLQEVIKDIELQYGIQIQLKTDLADKAFYGNLNMNDNIGQTLNKLCLVMETTWERNGGHYVILK